MIAYLMILMNYYSARELKKKGADRIYVFTIARTA